ncbi:MAG: NAD(+)/NADH kinase [Paramuribaculum sp.]|nr:NAD(+)/NADH kinase [Paramuribaculum sp.]
MQNIFLYGNPTQTSRINEVREFLIALTAAAGNVRLHAEPDYRDFLIRILPTAASSIEKAAAAPDEPNNTLALSIGGDGTFLTTANRIGRSGVPIMGINAGHLGYLSASNISDAVTIAERIVKGDYTTEPRTLISVFSSGAQLPGNAHALNEVAILKQDTASMITIEARIGDSPLATYTGDGLLISTPTGSTGYNLSVGGPIISPRCSDWVISPVAAHSLSMRPLVVPDSISLHISCRSRSGSMMLAIDGRSTPLPIDTRLELRKADFEIKVAHFPEQSFVHTLRHKLHWAE